MQGNYRITHTSLGSHVGSAVRSVNKAARAPKIIAKNKQEHEQRRAEGMADATARTKMHESEKRKTIKYKSKVDVKKYEAKAKVAIKYKSEVAKIKTSHAANRSAELKGRKNAPKHDLEVKKKRVVATKPRRVSKGNKI